MLKLNDKYQDSDNSEKGMKKMEISRDLKHYQTILTFKQKSVNKCQKFKNIEEFPLSAPLAHKYGNYYQEIIDILRGIVEIYNSLGYVNYLHYIAINKEIREKLTKMEKLEKILEI